MLNDMIGDKWRFKQGTFNNELSPLKHDVVLWP